MSGLQLGEMILDHFYSMTMAPTTGTTCLCLVLTYLYNTLPEHTHGWWMEHLTWLFICLQLYAIHAPLDEGSVSCVYALLSDKSETTYQELLTAVIDRCEELGHQPDQTSIVTDFEKAAINAENATLGDHVRTQGCFYHLMQATWRRIQSLGLTIHYRSDEDVWLHWHVRWAGIPASRGCSWRHVISLWQHSQGAWSTCWLLRPTLCNRIIPSHPAAPKQWWHWWVKSACVTYLQCTDLPCEWWALERTHVWSMESRVQYPCGPCSSHNMDTHWISMEGYFCCRGNTTTQEHWPAPKKRVRRHTKQLQEQLVCRCWPCYWWEGTTDHPEWHKLLHQAQVKYCLFYNLFSSVIKYGICIIVVSY